MFQRNPLPLFSGLKTLVAGSTKRVPNFHETFLIIKATRLTNFSQARKRGGGRCVLSLAVNLRVLKN
jgi:hypothetical protein